MGIPDLPSAFLLLFPLSVAAGVDLFLTLLFLVATQVLGGPMEDGAQSLHLGIFASLGTVYALEALAELRPLSALVWHNLQLLLRPLGGALIGLTLLEGADPPLKLLGAFLGATVCAFTHVITWGQKLLPFLTGERKVGPGARILAEDASVLAFLIWATDHPEAAFAACGVLLLAGILAGGPCHNVVRFGGFLLKDRVRNPFRSPRWRAEEDLPGWIGPAPSESGPGLRGIPAGALGLPGTRGFRDGWLLDTGGDFFFVSRKGRKEGRIPLAPFSPGKEEPGEITLRIPLASADGGRAALFLQAGAAALKSHK